MNRKRWRLAVGFLLVSGLASPQSLPSEVTEMRAVADNRAQGYTFVIDGQSVSGIYPGQTRYLKLTLANPFPFPLAVRELRGKVVRTSRTLCSPSEENLIVRAYAGRLPERIPPHSRKAISSLPVYMPRSATRDCASTVFIVHLTATAERAQR